jgi:serine/threonine-protein kinase
LVTSPGYPTLHDPTDPRQPPILPGEELAGKYRIENVIGAGAMGVVVRAWHIELEQPVAVKFLYPEFARNSDGAERFRREARAAAKIKNQHVARVLDVGTLISGAGLSGGASSGASARNPDGNSIPYIVMEYLDGRDLAHELREQGPLPVPLAVRYVMQACEAVAEAHERGIVHRDLKPANLFLAEGSRGERSIKVLDFGISKINGSAGAQQFSLTDTATLMGSPAYMSPEQLESSRNVDGRADIWSLGVILHELILGQVPFNGDSVPQLVRSILSGTRTTLLQRDAGLLELESVVARCLCQEREQRFETASALREALRPFADAALSSLASPPLPSARVEGSRSSLPGSLVGRAPGAAAAEAPSGADASTAPAAERNEPPGAAGVPSAWGNTQRGRHRSWQRHGLPLVLLLGVVGLGAYWVSHLASSPPVAATFRGGTSHPEAPTAAPANAAPMESRLANAPASARAEVPRKDPPPAEPAPAPAAQPVTASTLSEPSGGSESDPPRVRVVSGAGSSTAASPHPAGPVALPPAAAPVAPAKPGAAPVPAAASAAPAPPAAKVSAAGTVLAAHPTPPRTTVPDQGDKPKSEPSPRAGVVDVPDFGGRE